MSEDAAADQQALMDLVFHLENQRGRRLSKRGLKLAHYTSADTAVKVILGRQMWMRNASNMNDYLEVQHGSAGLRQALRDHGDRFSQALALFGGDFVTSILQSLDSADFNARFHTYLLSLSEHRPNDMVGRLSMWRAYGGPVAGVALVFNPIFLDFDTSDLAVWSSPVLYGAEDRLSTEFGRLVNALTAQQALLQRVGPDLVRNTIRNALQFAILSFKHPGFQEEREWRLIHMPRDTASAIVQPSFQTVDGAPEQVYHLPL